MRKRSILAVFCLMSSMMFAQNFTRAGAPVSVGPLVPSKSIESVVRSWSNVKFDNGRFIAFDDWNGPQIAFVGVDGIIEASVPLEIPNSARTSFYDAALQPDGTALVSGWTARSDGAVASFIAKVSRRGTETIYRTDAFAPYKLCSAANDEVWVLGRDIEREAGPTPVRPYPMLRLISLSRGTLRSALSSGLITQDHWDPFQTSLSCSNTAATAFFQQNGKIAQYSFADGSTRAWETNFSNSRDFSVGGFAVTGTGEAFASIVRHSKGEGQLASVFSVELRRETKNLEWRPVSFGDSKPVIGPGLNIMGLQGKKLVLSRGSGIGVIAVAETEP